MSKFDVEGAIVRIHDALYELDRDDLCGLGPSEVRNVLTNLGPAIKAEIRAAVLAGREEVMQLAESLGNDLMNQVDKKSADLIVMNARNGRILPDP